MEPNPTSDDSDNPSVAPRLHTQEWDLVTRREGLDTLPTFVELDGSFNSTEKLAKEYLDLISKKRSFALQNPKFQTWGTIINSTITNLVKDQRGPGSNGGPRVIENTDAINGNPPDWIKVILGFKAHVFLRSSGCDSDDYWRGTLGGYLVVISEGEWVIIRHYLKQTFPSDVDWEIELETRQMRAVEVQNYMDKMAKSYETMGVMLQGLKDSCQVIEAIRQEGAEVSLFDYNSAPAHGSIDEPLVVDDSNDESEQKVELQSLLRQGAPPEADDLDPAFVRHLMETRSQPTGGQFATGTYMAEAILSSSDPSWQNPTSEAQPSSNTSISVNSVLSGHISPQIPVSTSRNPIKRSAYELDRGFDFINELLDKGVSWERIRQLYKHEFNVERSLAGLTNWHSTCKITRSTQGRKRKSGHVDGARKRANHGSSGTPTSPLAGPSTQGVAEASQTNLVAPYITPMDVASPDEV
ncbi:hypothetical protein N7528_009361 [Penicillium herquei]|nr:hypothetical protein N7528_009361 [Penicillium herquei]